MCKICKFLADSKDKVQNHITESHSKEEYSNEKYLEKDSDFEIDEVNSSDESIIENVTESDTKRKNRSSRVTQANSDNTSKSKGRYIVL